MRPAENVYIEKLAEFSALLRQEGLAVGLQETADACAVLDAFGLEDRETVRAALCSVYAKSQQEQAAFGRAFDGFFVSLEQKQALLAQRQAEAQELAQRRAEAERDLQVGGKSMNLRDDLSGCRRRSGRICASSWRNPRATWSAAPSSTATSSVPSSCASCWSSR